MSIESSRRLQQHAAVQERDSQDLRRPYLPEQQRDRGCSMLVSRADFLVTTRRVESLRSKINDSGSKNQSVGDDDSLEAATPAKAERTTSETQDRDAFWHLEPEKRTGFRHRQRQDGNQSYLNETLHATSLFFFLPFQADNPVRLHRNGHPSLTDAENQVTSYPTMTQGNKLPRSIRSRLQQFDPRPVTAFVSFTPGPDPTNRPAKTTTRADTCDFTYVSRALSSKAYTGHASARSAKRPHRFVYLRRRQPGC